MKIEEIEKILLEASIANPYPLSVVKRDKKGNALSEEGKMWEWSHKVWQMALEKVLRDAYMEKQDMDFIEANDKAIEKLSYKHSNRR